MKITKIALTIAMIAMATASHAESFFQVEVGLGAAHTIDMGDGVWQQRGSPLNSERTNTPFVTGGLLFPIWRTGAWDFRLHADYSYIGTMRASVDGVPDQFYDPHTHRDLPGCNCRYSPFNGQGHVQGVSFTADIGYTALGYRFGFEAGPWVYWQTWHESVYDLAGKWDNLSHRTVPQVGYVVGASVSKGNFSTAIRYYSVAQKWNPYPGLSRGAIAVFTQYTF